MTAALLFLLLFGLALLFWPKSDEPETVEGVPVRHAQERAVAKPTQTRELARIDDVIEGEVLDTVICAEPDYIGSYVTFSTSAERAQYRQWLHEQPKG